MKKAEFTVLVLLAASLMGCSNEGVDFASKAHKLAECTLTGQGGCDNKLSSGAEMKTERATLFHAQDSIRVSLTLEKEADCRAFGTVGGNGKNTTVAINNIVTKRYGEEMPGSLDKACKDGAPYSASLTVAKTS